MPQLQSLDELSHLLQQEIEAYSTVCQLLRQKKAALLANTLDELARVDTRLRQAKRPLQGLERQRLALVAQLGVPSCKLPDLLATLPPQCEERQHLQQVRETLRMRLEECRALNDQVERLLLNALGWVRQTLEVLHGPVQPEPTGQAYTEKGFATAPSKPAFAHAAQWEA